MTQPPNDSRSEALAAAAAAAARTTASDALRKQLQAALEGTFEIGERLGEGGMGAVFIARDLAEQRTVAIKVMRPVPGTETQSWLRRFQQEASALASLSHPGIVEVFGSGQTSELAWIVMEAVEGTSLRELMRQDALSPAEALAVAPAMCRALQYAHDHGVVHRDIKPENVLVDMEGRVRLVDFGLAMLRDENGARLTKGEEVLGTLRYMAPEQLDAPLEVDHRADIFSMGVVLYEMLTGKVPHGIVHPPSTQVQVDVRFDEVVLRSLEREPARRYQLASDVAQRMEEIEAGAAAHPASVNAQPELSPAQDRRMRREQYRSGRVLDVAVVGTSLALFAGLRLRVAPAFGLEDWSIWTGLAVTLVLGLPLVAGAAVSVDRTRVSLPMVRISSALLALATLIVAGALVGSFDGDRSRAAELTHFFRGVLLLPMLPLLTATLSARYPISFLWKEQTARRLWGLGLVVSLGISALAAYPWARPMEWNQYAIMATGLGVLLLAARARGRAAAPLRQHAILMVSAGITSAALILWLPVTPGAHSEMAQTGALFLGALLALAGAFLGAGLAAATPSLPGDPPSRYGTGG